MADFTTEQNKQIRDALETCEGRIDQTECTIAELSLPDLPSGAEPANTPRVRLTNPDGSPRATEPPQLMPEQGNVRVRVGEPKPMPEAAPEQPSVRIKIKP